MTTHDHAAPAAARSRLRAPRLLAALLGALLIGSAGLAPLSPASAVPQTLVVSDTTCQTIAENIAASAPAEVTPRTGGGFTCFVPAGYFQLDDDFTIEVPPGWTLQLDTLSSAAVITTSDSCGPAGEADACGIVLKYMTNKGTVQINSSASSVLAGGSIRNEGLLALGAAADGAAPSTFTNSGDIDNVGTIEIDTAAVFTNNYTVTNYCDSTQTGTVVNIAPFDACTPPTLSGDAPDGSVDVNYEYTYKNASDPRAGTTLTVVDGALPPGLYLNSGVLIGYPSGIGTFTYTILAQNRFGESRLTDTIVISGVAPTISGTPAAGMVGEDYYYTYTLTGGPAPVVSLASGTLPPGIGFDPYGALSGRPTTAGSYTFTTQAVNSAGRAETTSTITVSPKAVAKTADLRVDLSAPSTATKGTRFSYTVATRNAGPATATSAFTKVILPTGVEFVSATGTYKRYGPIIVFSSPSLANGRTTTQKITVKATTNDKKTATAATFSTKTPDTEIRNNADTATTTIR